MGHWANGSHGDWKQGFFNPNAGKAETLLNYGRIMEYSSKVKIQQQYTCLRWKHVKPWRHGYW